ncbi:MAG TPA: hypothetical protein VLY45_05635 [Nitrospiria bacterium]|nr:hypothetical protein [Nitrospiria bacterium]
MDTRLNEMGASGAEGRTRFMAGAPLIRRRPIRVVLLLSSCVVIQGCVMQQWGAELQWSSKSQILMSERSQVRLRSIQSRVFDTTDRPRIMKAAVDVMQDMYFDIDVLDEALGVASGKKLYPSGGYWVNDPTYYAYRTDELIIFNDTNFRTWGPFEYRRDLTRMTVTVRPKETTRSLVRVSVQYNLRAVEDPETYQKFFAALERAMFLSAKMD